MTPGFREKRPIPQSELAKHCTADDAWIALHGKCYNVTAYMDFHPGGEYIVLMANEIIDFETIENFNLYFVSFVGMLDKGS